MIYYRHQYSVFIHAISEIIFPEALEDCLSRFLIMKKYLTAALLARNKKCHFALRN